jgi:transposase-like protein
MSLVDDILKGLPINPLLREKVAELEAKYAATETQNAILRDDLRDAKAENQKLKKQVEELTQSDDLDETELKLLLLIANTDYSDAVTQLFVEQFSGITKAKFDYHLKRLQDLGYVVGGYSNSYGIHYRATQEGRTLLLKKNLL